MSSPLPIIPGRLPAAPLQYERDNEAMTRRIIELALSRGPTASGGGLHNREDFTVTTAELEPCEGEDGTIDLEGSSGDLIIVTTSSTARVRVYATAAGRTADTDRPTWRDPDPGIGVLLDLVTDGEQVFLLQPATYIYNADTPHGNVVYYRITNYGDAAAVIAVVFTVIVMEE